MQPINHNVNEKTIHNIKQAADGTGMGGTTLGTAIIQIVNCCSQEKTLRALCDNGSQINLISQKGLEKLKLKSKSAKITLLGVSGKPLGEASQKVELHIALPNSGDVIKSIFYVVKNITTYQPSASIKNIKNLVKSIDLADPGFNDSKEIEALLGITIWIQILQPGMIKAADELAAVQNTKLGWVVFAMEKDSLLTETSYIGMITANASDSLKDILLRFWELESTKTRQYFTKEEEMCERIFEKEHSRAQNGQYIVKLPF